jgi:hypothetical protein
MDLMGWEGGGRGGQRAGAWLEDGTGREGQARVAAKGRVMGKGEGTEGEGRGWVGWEKGWWSGFHGATQAPPSPRAGGCFKVLLRQPPHLNTCTDQLSGSAGSVRMKPMSWDLMTAIWGGGKGVGGGGGVGGG